MFSVQTVIGLRGDYIAFARFLTNKWLSVRKKWGKTCGESRKSVTFASRNFEFISKMDDYHAENNRY